MPSIPGPFEEISVPKSGGAPLYLVPFDKKGRCEGPQTRADLLSTVRSGAFTDVHVFSHGWNNVFRDAVHLYREFFTEYFALRHETNVSDVPYKPLLVGLLWPSTALVSTDDATPQFASGLPREARDAAFFEEQAARREVASEVRDENVERFHELTSRDRVSRDEALELATILLPILDRQDQTGEEVHQDVTPEKLVRAWEAAARVEAAGPGLGQEAGAPGALPDEDQVEDTTPVTAGLLDFLNPKNIIRTATVYLMKDRAGTVGANGVAALVQDLLASDGVKVHLMGHSYGAKVVLSALTVPPQTRKVASMLLLQPAVNHLCFAANVDGRVGGYRQALDRVERGIFTTFSGGDVPLSRTFHLALRRDGDLAEVKIAGVPSRFAALGGFGPGGLSVGELRTMDILAPPQPYPPAPPGVKITALNGSGGRITGHGDVRNSFTEWALANLTR